jgi:GTP-binding protein EngB required for normal cell division
VTSGQDSLNSNHQRRLTVTCRHIDRLLAEMEGALHVAGTKSAFPQYVPDLTRTQLRVVEDYIDRIRAQLIRVLDGQGIDRPRADVPVSRSLHSHLAFIEIAAEEMKPEYMRGYGEIPPAAAVELNGIAAELQGLVGQLDRYLTRGAREDLEERLTRLEQSGQEVSLLKKLQSVITEQGMIEFRSRLSMILDRLEDNSFEIALFGRVSSGKSSLLNCILGTDVLPVGVTPITAVPTRLVYGEAPAVDVWFANREPQRLDISRLPELAAEHFNPGNEKHVTRMVVRIPSPRLREGITFVDTPGLGSLAISGAAETLAYLPRCDLGVVLIDAASTLTPEDLHTIQILCEQGIPAHVLLSKADLLNAEDCSQVMAYIKDHIKRELKLDLTVRAVSAMPQAQSLLNRWFDEGVSALYSQRDELKVRSIRRKMGALRQSVETALRSRLERKDPVSAKKVEQLRGVESELRQASGHLEEMKKIAKGVANDLELSGYEILGICAATLIKSWNRQEAGDQAETALLREAVTQAVDERTGLLRRRLDHVAQQLFETLCRAAKVLEVEDVPVEAEFSGVLREMPSFDPGTIELQLKRSFYLGLLGGKLATSVMAKRLAASAGDQLARSLSTYHVLLGDWSERTINQMQRKFEAYANSYRAQVERVVGHGVSRADQGGLLGRNLDVLENAPRGGL